MAKLVGGSSTYHPVRERISGAVLKIRVTKLVVSSSKLPCASTVRPRRAARVDYMYVNIGVRGVQASSLEVECGV